ncbi:hypothetical protein [Pedobacter sp. BAL39]|nr:hypothetical protein [Pedobacter sp. BAL39]
MNKTARIVTAVILIVVMLVINLHNAFSFYHIDQISLTQFFIWQSE